MGLRIPNLPVLSSLPLDKAISLGGLSVHSHWLGGDSSDDGGQPTFADVRYGFRFKDWEKYNFFATPTYIPDGYYIAGPDTGTSAATVFTGMQDWNFFSPMGINDNRVTRSALSMSIPLEKDPKTSLAPHGVTWTNNMNFFPWPQHYVLARATKTLLPDHLAPIWPPGDPTSAPMIAAYAHWNTILIVIDGTGSFSSGTDADAHLHSLMSTMQTHNGDAKVIATKFSDFASPRGPSEPGDKSAVLLGTWKNTSNDVATAVMAASDATDTGDGGDNNESQFEGIQLGLLTAEKLGWNIGKRAVIVYTDAASVFLFGGGESSALRLNQRDDGLGVTGHARLNSPGAPNSATSVQGARAPRIAGPNTYA